MRRLIVRSAAALTCALATTGCTSLSLDYLAALTSPSATEAPSDAASAPYGEIASKLPHDLDGEIRRAQLLRASSDFPGAAHALSQLMLVAPDDPRVVGEYGKVLTQEGRTDDALAFLQRAVELQQDNWTLYSALGVAYDQHNEPAKAQTAYKQALALKPNDATVLNNYAMSLMLAGDLDRADALLHQAAASGGDFPKIASNLEVVDEMRAKSAKAAKGSDMASKPATVGAEAALPAAGTAVPAKFITEAGQPRRLQPNLAQKPLKDAALRGVTQEGARAPLAGNIYGAQWQPGENRTGSLRLPGAIIRGASTSGPAAPIRLASATPALRTAADTY